MQNELNDEKPN